MDALSTPQFWQSWVRIVLIDLALAGDNAVVIALAVRALPQRERFLGRLFGTMGAVVLRVGLIFIVTRLLEVPYLKCIGGLLLIGIAYKLIQPEKAGPEYVRRGSNLKESIAIIMVADIVMSLDNVLAIAAAAGGDFFLVAFGLALSLPLVVWGSGLLAALMDRLPVIIWLGGGVLEFVAMDLILHDEFVARWLGEWRPGVQRFAPYILGAVTTAAGWWLSRGVSRAKRAGPTE